MKKTLSVLAVLAILGGASQAEPGAPIPWTTYQAEEMTLVNATVLGPPGLAPDLSHPLPNCPEMEASGRRCVRLGTTGAAVEFRAQAAANTMVVRYCLPDSADGQGLDSSLQLSVNGLAVANLPVTSKYSWRYGAYPFSNRPSEGNPRNFYDEVRLKDLHILSGDTVRIEKTADQTAAFCLLDLVDLEQIDPPRAAPEDALSVLDFGARNDGVTEATIAFQTCIDQARKQGKSVWIPAGTYLIAGALQNLREVTIQGAGMWHTTLIGDPTRYNREPTKRVRFTGSGDRLHLADFAILGHLDHRNDEEPQDALCESFGTGSTISRIWIEHTKTGAWIQNTSGLVIEGCRFRNLIADGVNFSVGVRSSTVHNCTARGTGDDAFAIWPATYTAQQFAPGLNTIQHCTAGLNSLANGAAIYGGESNSIQDCRFEDFPFGCGILISGTFPVHNQEVQNQFRGQTTVERCEIIRAGGFDSGWKAWRGALTICPHFYNIPGLRVEDLVIRESLSSAIAINSPGSDPANPSKGHLIDALLRRITISQFGLAVPTDSPAAAGPALHVRPDALGSMSVLELSIDGAPLQSLSSPFLLNQSPRQNGNPRFGIQLNGVPAAAQN